MGEPSWLALAATQRSAAPSGTTKNALKMSSTACSATLRLLGRCLSRPPETATGWSWRAATATLLTRRFSQTACRHRSTCAGSSPNSVSGRPCGRTNESRLLPATPVPGPDPLRFRNRPLPEALAAPGVNWPLATQRPRRRSTTHRTVRRRENLPSRAARFVSEASCDKSSAAHPAPNQLREQMHASRCAEKRSARPRQELR